MPTSAVNGQDLLDVVKRMPPEAFEAFIEEALSMRTGAKTNTLSAKETKLIKRINRGLPVQFPKRWAQLVARRSKGSLTVEEHHELLQLTDEAERRDADRAAALLELAKLRRVPVRLLMKEMGIKPPAIHG